MDVAIGGLGIASSLGVGSVGACAAARAGISRAAELDYSVIHAVDDDVETIFGHCVPGLTRGFEGDGRLLRLAQLAFDDLRGAREHLAAAPACTGMWIALPTAAEGGQEGEETADGAPAEETALHDAAFLGRLAELTGHGIAEEDTHIVRAGHAGAATSVHQAVEAMEAGRYERCLVGAVDSLVDEPSLERLEQAGRLKCSANPAGLSPGEAAVFLWLEPPGRSEMDGPAPIALRTVLLGSDEDPFHGDDQPTGVAIAELSRRLFAQHPPREREAVLVSDQNGEACRGIEWGYLLLRLAEAHPWLGDAPLLLPAVSFGDTGAASGGLNLASGLHELWRNRSGIKSAIVWSSADSGQRAVLALERADG